MPWIPIERPPITAASNGPMKANFRGPVHLDFPNPDDSWIGTETVLIRFDDWFPRGSAFSI